MGASRSFNARAASSILAPVTTRKPSHAVIYASLLCRLLPGLIVTVLTILVVSIGPIAGLVGYIAMVARLRKDPDNSLAQGSWGLLTSAALEADP